MNEQFHLTDAQAPADPTPPQALHQLLRARHQAPEWAFLEEVAPKTGGGTRYADAVAVNLWQSRGHAVEGFEVKVSRSDWLRELKQPEKAEPVMRYCDHWWLVTEKDVVKPGELPLNWGHMVRRGTGLVVATPAPRLEAQPVTRAFFASLMRRGFEQVGAVASQQWADKHAAMLREHRADLERERAGQLSELKHLRETVAKFEKATGIRIDNGFRDPIPTLKLAQRLRDLQGYGADDRGLGRLTELASELERAATVVRNALAQTGMGDGQRQLGAGDAAPN